MIYYFDRYLGSVKMAQGAKVTMARSEKDAIDIAKSLFKRDEYNYFTLRKAKKQRTTEQAQN